MFWRSCCRIFLWLYLIFGVIGAVIIASIVGGSQIFIFLIVVIVVILSVCQFGLLVEMSDILARIESNTAQKGNNNNKSGSAATPVFAGNRKIPLTAEVADVETGQFWFCRNCGSRNKEDARFCKDCGTDKGE